MLKVCRSPGPTYSLLKVVTESVFEKVEKGEIIHDWTWAALNLQPSDYVLQIVQVDIALAAIYANGR